MTNASLPPNPSTSVLPPALLTAYSDSEEARILEITAMENYKALMRSHHTPLSNDAKLLVLKAKDAVEELRLSKLAASLTLV